MKHKVSALITQSPGDTVQTGTGKADPARKLKCTTAARVRKISLICRDFYNSISICKNCEDQSYSVNLGCLANEREPKGGFRIFDRGGG